ncbi:hypothetical protein RUE5091_00083 [Ruegeria denitrificans]|uniref:Uncharacterized protein n=1 Tax=Ruegeria denitrificans TaxID=1715692 RepID=A0A0P1I0L6_9RHOB|nr:hypothetical protein RUE5091_00083 [Ruegeria denitrificans]
MCTHTLTGQTSARPLIRNSDLQADQMRCQARVLRIKIGEYRALEVLILCDKPSCYEVGMH